MSAGRRRHHLAAGCAGRYILIPERCNKYYGLETLTVSEVSGKWNNEAEAWVFNNGYTKFFTERGASFIPRS